MKLGPWASSETRALVRGTPDMFLTHSSNCVVVSVVTVAVAGAKVHVLVFFEQPPELFEWPTLV